MVAGAKVWQSGAWVSLDEAQIQLGASISDGVDTATSSRPTVSCTASATPHQPGTWVEVDASLSADVSHIRFSMTGTTGVSANNSSTLLEIGTGGSGAETVIATAGVGYITTGTSPGPSHIVIPGFIAAGTRVAVRARSAVAGQVVVGLYTFYGVQSAAPLAPVTIGADTATSRGITVTAPGSLNTKGSWLELAASTSQDIHLLGVYPQGAGGTGMAASGVLIDIGVGAASSETVIINDIYLIGTTGESYANRTGTLFGVNIPAGSRIAARYARAAAGNAVDLILVGA